MPNILSLPRELRNQIYHHSLEENLPSSHSHLLQQPRKEIIYNVTDPDNYLAEGRVRYPETTSLPTCDSLLQTCRQMRVEMLDCMKRMGPLRYKIDLVNRVDKYLLYPTWVFVPAFSKHIDVLDVDLRIRWGKTSSVVSASGDGYDRRCGGKDEPLNAGLVLLQRFLERGVYFLSKKKRQKISIGVLAVNVILDLADEEDIPGQKSSWASFLDVWLRDDKLYGFSTEETEEEACRFRFLAGRVEKFRLSFMGKVEREWVLAEMVAKRDEKLRQGVVGDGA